MSKYILTIDQGTTSSRAIIFDEHTNKIAVKHMEFRQITPKSGWVLHNPNEIYLTVVQVIKEVLDMAGLKAKDISCIGITNQRETTVIWDKETLEEVYPAIVWQSRQSEAICDKLIEDGYRNMIFEKTGLLINPYFSASKIKWIFDNVEGVKERALKGELCVGTIDTYLLYRLTNKKSFKTDYTNASRTMLFNIKDLCWDQELLDLFGVPKCMLPEVCDSSSLFGYYELNGAKIPIMSMIGDQQSSMIGHTAFGKGDCKITYGTGAFMLLNTDSDLVYSKNGLLTTIGYKIGNKITYCLEGSVFVAGSAVQWLRDGLQIITKSPEVEDLANRVEDSNGVYFVPAFVGLGSPYWDNEVRGAIFGLSRGATKEHLARATLEGIAYSVYDVLEVMKIDSGIDISQVSVDGGAASNNYLIQFESDITNMRLDRPKELETTALGACYLAGLEAKIFKDFKHIKKYHGLDQIFMPSMEKQDRKKLIEGWNKAVLAARMFK